MSDVATKHFVLLGVLPGSKAEAAGLKKGDKIIAINDRSIQSVQDFIEATEQPGDRLVSYIRGNTFGEVTLSSSIPAVDPATLTPEYLQETLSKR